MQYGTAPRTIVGLHQAGSPQEAREIIESIEPSSRATPDRVLLAPALDLLGESVLFGDEVREASLKGIVIVSSHKSSDDDAGELKSKLDALRDEESVVVLEVATSDVSSSLVTEVSEALCDKLTPTTTVGEHSNRRSCKQLIVP